MRKIGEVLRLAAEGLSHREISRSTGLAKSTISELSPISQNRPPTI